MTADQPKPTNDATLLAKAALRRKVATSLGRFSPTEIAALSARACARLQLQPEWKNARTILAFAPLPGELDLWPAILEAIAQGKTVALPRFAPDHGHYEPCQVLDPARDLLIGRYSIREPASHCTRLPANRLDFVLVPGVAFDPHGRRLGRGKGYYDRLLASVCGTKCGAGFEEQIVESIPIEPHDVYLNCILTPARWVVCQRSAPVME